MICNECPAELECFGYNNGCIQDTIHNMRNMKCINLIIPLELTDSPFNIIDNLVKVKSDKNILDLTLVLNVGNADNDFKYKATKVMQSMTSNINSNYDFRSAKYDVGNHSKNELFMTCPIQTDANKYDYVICMDMEYIKYTSNINIDNMLSTFNMRGKDMNVLFFNDDTVSYVMYDVNAVKDKIELLNKHIKTFDFVNLNIKDELYKVYGE